jgi:hypothetical protein
LAFLDARGLFPVAPVVQPVVKEEPTEADLEEAEIRGMRAPYATKAFARTRAFESSLDDSEGDLSGVVSTSDQATGDDGSHHDEKSGEEFAKEERGNGQARTSRRGRLFDRRDPD